jgi:hypothetical protein
MVFDSSRGVSVLFGGYNGTFNSDTWEWNGTAWTQKAVTGPGGRWSHAMAFDSSRNVTVMFGGTDTMANSSFQQTWEYGPACTAPSITTQPIGRNACSGTPVSFSLVTGGSAPTFQWRKDGVNISGATAATLTVASASATDAGNYDCVATNACGTITSSVATLTVTPLLSVSQQPVDQAAAVDAPVTFYLEASDAAGCSNPVTYQWQRRDPTVADENAANAWIDLRSGPQFVNATGNALVIAHPIPALATGYRCKIGGGCGCRPASGFVYSNTVNFSIACPADFNADGGIDFADVEAFFERWENGC